MYSGQAWTVQNYDKKIRYLDYMENGARSHGAGFIKLEQRDGTCNINLQISGLYRKDRFTRPFLLLRGEEEREICKLQLQEGGVKIYIEKLDCHNMDGRGLEYEQVTGLRVPISEGKEIRCLWENGYGGRENRAEPAMQREDAMQKLVLPKAVPETSQESTQELLSVEPTDNREDRLASEEQSSASIHSDKWQQLWAIYPHVKPFRDEREYLSMGPADFVILPGRHYKLVNNSFLLHGYYNYHHLIMSRVEERNQVKYYIGVPGNFYEREKKIAVMFGFESFECSAEPAEEGDFGYYMIAVEL